MRNVDEIFKITVNLYLNISYYFILSNTHDTLRIPLVYKKMSIG